MQVSDTWLRLPINLEKLSILKILNDSKNIISYLIDIIISCLVAPKVICVSIRWDFRFTDMWYISLLEYIEGYIHLHISIRRCIEMLIISRLKTLRSFTVEKLIFTYILWYPSLFYKTYILADWSLCFT